MRAVAPAVQPSIARSLLQGGEGVGWAESSKPNVGLRRLSPTYSCEPAPIATHAISELETFSISNFLAAAAMRVSACAIGIGGFVSPFFGLWKRTGLMRATT